MKVVALVSGGKDSCYAAMKCVAYGHELSVLANVHPPEGVDEADSFMYQTVGHEAIEAYSECFDLPLIRQETSANCKNSDLVYSKTQGDEVEDLELLLERVRTKHTDVQGISSGAVLSNYQRLRVENVASRLGMTSLAYLWRRDQKSLLREMIESGVDAILIKVAAVGLDPRKHLGKTLTEMESTLLDLDARYGVSVCGEGGEFETLVLDCPLFKKRVVIDSSRVVITSDDRYAPVGFLKIESYHLEDKTLAEDPEHLIPKRKEFSVLEPVDEAPDAIIQRPLSINGEEAAASSTAFGTYAYYAVRTSKDREAGMSYSLQQVETMMAKDGFNWKDAFYVNLYINDMSQFGLINKEYCKFLPETEPSARACIECSGGGTSVEVLATKKSRKTLHVQSISEWAPPCIGPYAQSNQVDDFVHLAGVIPLFPPTVSIPSGLGSRSQIQACCENLEAVLQETETTMSLLFQMVVFTSRIDPEILVNDNSEIASCFPCAKLPPLSAIIAVSRLPKDANVEICCDGFRQNCFAPVEELDGAKIFCGRLIKGSARTFVQMYCSKEPHSACAEVVEFFESKKFGSLLSLRLFSELDIFEKACNILGRAFTFVRTKSAPLVLLEDGQWKRVSLLVQAQFVHEAPQTKL